MTRDRALAAVDEPDPRDHEEDAAGDDDDRLKGGHRAILRSPPADVETTPARSHGHDPVPLRVNFYGFVALKEALDADLAFSTGFRTQRLLSDTS
jgi:hypothetical protein